VKEKHITISSRSDLSKISQYTKSIHFRKFLSRRIVNDILNHRNVEFMSINRHIANKYQKILDEFKYKEIKIKILKRGRGRPSLIENVLRCRL